MALARRSSPYRARPAAPDMALSPTGGPLGMWPDGYPTPPTRPFPLPWAVTYGAGLSVTVYDTGCPTTAMATWGRTWPADAGRRRRDRRQRRRVADLYYAGPHDGHRLA